MTRARAVYYGWWVLAVAFAGEMFAIGSTTYAFGLFVKPLSEAYNADRATINLGLMLFIVGMGLSAPVLGRLLDRFPARRLMPLGALIMGGGMAAVALSPTLGLMALCVLLPVSIGATLIGPLAANTLGARWFVRRRGLALGIIAIGTSAGGTLLVPLMAFTMERYGWRGALLIQGALIALVVGALTLWVVRNRPQDLGLQPDGDAAPPLAAATGAAAAPEVRWTVAQTLRQRDFWCIALAVALTFAVNQSTLISLVPYGTDRGFTLQQAQWLVSALAACSILGKLVLGALADRVDKRWLLLVVVAAIGVEQTTLLLQPGFAVLLVVCGLAGFASGGTLPLWAALIGERFGAASFGSVMGLMNPVNMIASLVAIGFIGRTFDVTGSYDLAFTIFLGVAVVAAVMTLLITARPPVLPHAAPATS
jgi:sugar phosphate permease